MKRAHFHPDGTTEVINGKTFIGIKESKTLKVCEDGTFITRLNKSGNFKGCKHRDAGSYLTISVGRIQPYAHRVVYEACSGKEIPEGREIDHINNNSQDNRLENLRVVSRLENMRNPLTVKRQKAWLTRAHSDSAFEAKRKAAQRVFATSPEHANRLRAYGERKSRPVICTDIRTGKSYKFDHQFEAVRKLGLVSSSISSCCNGKLKTTGGYTCRRP